jgi:hypothetical protein
MKLYNQKGVQRATPKQARLLTPENEKYVMSLRRLLGLH